MADAAKPGTQYRMMEEGASPHFQIRQIRSKK